MPQQDFLRLRHKAKPPVGGAENKIREKDSLLQHLKEKLLILWGDLPEWSRDNEYIQFRFHRPSHSYWKCLQSCFYIHNETGNIYSHLLATLWMMALPLSLYPYAKSRCPSANFEDWTVFALFFLGGASCFALLTIYHILANHSHTTHDFCHQHDFLGIIVVTAGLFPVRYLAYLSLRCEGD